MATSPTIKPNHKAIEAYYEALLAYVGQNVTHETAVRSAFQNLLAETGKLHKWTLIPELTMKVKGKSIRPDGTMRDGLWFFPRGYWEAKDSDDKLDAEIRKKINLGYPTTNIIFEDTKAGVLYQNGKEVFKAKLNQPQELADLLNLFFNHTERDLEGFEQAVVEFKERIPLLAKALLEKIQESHQVNLTFGAAFDSLLQLCQSSLNPNISKAAVDEMLVQHLLTERIFDKVFQNQDFLRRNVIAAEVERAIEALVSKSFNRHEFLKSLDPFYKAIEEAARTIEDFSEKQQFLNTVYERFFQGYCVRLADTHGIVYTPQAIVDFMCSSVEEVLKTDFKTRLGSEGVSILDPCTGTGNFIVNLIRRIDRRELPDAYRKRLFANEVMLLPYYIAAQNIEHEYSGIVGEYAPFEGLCFVDTLELAESGDGTLDFMNVVNTTRVKRQKASPITVVIGNPPYNMGQVDENDNNKNRQYKVIDGRVAETYGKSSTAILKNKLYDPYVKFFRWAMDRIQGRDGIVCYVTNNSFVDQIAFDGMRQHLLQDFTRVYHLDLHGNVRENPKLSGTTHNVFGIQVGVGITVAVRSSKHKDRRLYHYRVPEDWKKEQKLSWVAERKNIAGVDWEKLTPDARNTWLVSKNALEFAAFLPMSAGMGSGIFGLSSLGIATNRDEWAYDFTKAGLEEKLRRLINNYTFESFRLTQMEERPSNIDNFVNNDPTFIKWTDRLKTALANGQALKYDSTQIRRAMTRPFVKEWVYFDNLLVHRRYQQHRIFPTDSAENRVIAVSQVGFRSGTYNTFMTDCIPDLHLCASIDGHQCFSYYVYDEDGTNRRENISDEAVGRFQKQYGDSSISKWNVFYYVYGVLHHPDYRMKFADDLKRELPRIPFMADFRAFSDAGEKLASLHLNYENIEPWPLVGIYAQDRPLSYRVEKMRLNKDKSTLFVNETLSFGEIPPETLEYRFGSRSALDWLIDQYQVSTDKRSEIVTDPNRPEDPEYIVKLVERVIRVSMETVEIIKSLPAL